MNLPNKLTLIRAALVPVFVALLMAPKPVCQLLAAIVFGLASLTDLFDGWYARKYDLVTDFGKLMDPMADKLLVMAALVGLLARGNIPWLAVMILLGREFIISGIRLVAAAKGVVIPADRVGKFKTAAQMVGLAFVTAAGYIPFLMLPGEILLWISVVLSVWSCAEYIVKSKEVFKP